MWWEYIDIIASNIPRMKITAVCQWTARFNINRMTEYAGVYLEISLLDWPQRNPKTFPKFQQNSRTFQDSFQIPGLSRTFQDCWEPWIMIILNFLMNYVLTIAWAWRKLSHISKIRGLRTRYRQIHKTWRSLQKNMNLNTGATYLYKHQ